MQRGAAPDDCAPPYDSRCRNLPGTVDGGLRSAVAPGGRNPPRANIEDALYISSPKMVKRASLGFDGLMACIYWTRTVQYFGDRHARRIAQL